MTNVARRVCAVARRSRHYLAVFLPLETFKSYLKKKKCKISKNDQSVSGESVKKEHDSRLCSSTISLHDPAVKASFRNEDR